MVSLRFAYNNKKGRKQNKIVVDMNWNHFSCLFITRAKKDNVKKTNNTKMNINQRTQTNCIRIVSINHAIP